MLSPEEFLSLRTAIAAIPADVSNDAVGSYAPKLEDIFAPEMHATALDPSIPIVVGSRGAGKSFWAGVLGQNDTRQAAAIAYPRLDLGRLSVAFGFTGAVGPGPGHNSRRHSPWPPRSFKDPRRSIAPRISVDQRRTGAPIRFAPPSERRRGF